MVPSETFVSVLFVVTIVGCYTALAVTGEHAQNREDFPYQVAIVVKKYETGMCGGAIISSSHVVTSAECLHDHRGKPVSVGDIKVHGESLYWKNGDIKSAITYYVHPNYKYSKSTGINRKMNDIGIIQLEKSYDPFTTELKPIELQRGGVSDGTACTVSHWVTLNGDERDPKLSFLKVPILERARCDDKLGNAIGTICAGFDPESERWSSCYNDGSGQPLVCNGKLVGISSYGRGCPLDHCSHLYTEISQYSDWINQVIKEEGDKNNPTTTTTTTTTTTPTAKPSKGLRYVDSLQIIVFCTASALFIGLR